MSLYEKAIQIRNRQESFEATLKDNVYVKRFTEFTIFYSWKVSDSAESCLDCEILNITLNEEDLPRDSFIPMVVLNKGNDDMLQKFLIDRLSPSENEKVNELLETLISIELEIFDFACVMFGRQTRGILGVRLSIPTTTSPHKSVTFASIFELEEWISTKGWDDIINYLRENEY